MIIFLLIKKIIKITIIRNLLIGTIMTTEKL